MGGCCVLSSMTITVNGKTWFDAHELSEQALKKAVVAFRSYFIFESPLTDEMAGEFLSYAENLVGAFNSVGIKLTWDTDIGGFCVEQATYPKLDSSNLAELAKSAEQFVNVNIEQDSTTQLSYDKIIDIATQANESFYSTHEWLHTSGDYPKRYFVNKHNVDSLALIQDYIKYIVADYLVCEVAFFDESRLLNRDYPDDYLQLYFSEDGSEMTTLADLEKKEEA